MSWLFINSSDKFIADTLDKFNISYKIGDDPEGNKGVFITANMDIYSTHPDKERSLYSITTTDFAFNTKDLEKSIKELINHQNGDGEEDFVNRY